jgi:hypothetical protein
LAAYNPDAHRTPDQESNEISQDHTTKKDKPGQIHIFNKKQLLRILISIYNF